jgi:hypothetical protein
MIGWSLKYRKNENNIRNNISNEPLFLDINKFIQHLKFKVGLEMKIYGNNFTKEFFMPKNLDDFDEKYIREIKNFEYVYYDTDMSTMCWIEVHQIIN